MMHCTIAFSVFIQTVLYMTAGMLILTCSWAPTKADSSESITMKMLYLYEPSTCLNAIRYNYTLRNSNFTIIDMQVVEIRNNPVAIRVREQMTLQIIFHACWSLFAFFSLTFVGQRECAFYFVYLPFVCFGIIICIYDVVIVIMYCMDIQNTITEGDIINYVGAGPVRAVPYAEPDTSWASMLMAFLSARFFGVWSLNLWLVKDVYIEAYTFMCKS